MRIYVGNLPFHVGEDELRKEFEAWGKVESATVVRDRYSGQSRGFGFIDMPNREEGEAAISGLKGKMLDDRTLDINEAHPRPDRGPGGGGGGGGGRRPPQGGSKGKGRQKRW